eukprot:359371-Chlamydomonas_euryale.AAC.3
MPKALGSAIEPNLAMEHIDENKQANGGPFATLSGKRLTDDGRTSRNNAHASNDIVKAPSIHGEEVSCMGSATIFGRIVRHESAPPTRGVAAAGKRGWR